MPNRTQAPSVLVVAGLAAAAWIAGWPRDRIGYSQAIATAFDGLRSRETPSG